MLPSTFHGSTAMLWGTDLLHVKPMRQMRTVSKIDSWLHWESVSLCRCVSVCTEIHYFYFQEHTSIGYSIGYERDSDLSTTNIIANVRHAWLYDCAVRAMRKKLKLIYNGGDSGSKKYKWGCGGVYGGVWRSLLLVGSVVRRSVLCWWVWLQAPWRCFQILFN
jgi:hypothetical protein